ncbi:MAG: hypothetical protein GDA51_03275 [Ekhidna sp.]|nr:hypothetical protein [Ekhidna sp.]
MLRQSREDCCNAIVVILNLQGFENLEGFSNIIINKNSLFSSKHVCVRQRKLRESGRAFRKVSHPQKIKVNASSKQKGLLQCYRRYFKPSRFSKP